MRVSRARPLGRPFAGSAAIRCGSPPGRRRQTPLRSGVPVAQRKYRVPSCARTMPTVSGSQHRRVYATVGGLGQGSQDLGGAVGLCATLHGSEYRLLRDTLPTPAVDRHGWVWLPGRTSAELGALPSGTSTSIHEIAPLACRAIPPVCLGSSVFSCWSATVPVEEDQARPRGGHTTHAARGCPTARTCSSTLNGAARGEFVLAVAPTLLLEGGSSPCDESPDGRPWPR
jgi:hypothetical protein